MDSRQKEVLLDDAAKRVDRLEEQEKRLEILGAIQDEIAKLLDMSDKLMKIADEVERVIGEGSNIEMHICDIGLEYLEIHHNVSDLMLEAWLNEKEYLQSYKDPHYRKVG